MKTEMLNLGILQYIVGKGGGLLFVAIEFALLVQVCIHFLLFCDFCDIVIIFFSGKNCTEASP